MRRQRCTRILATLGPATGDPAAIAKLFQAGADAFRLNFSHGRPADHERNLNAIRDLEARTGRPGTPTASSATWARGWPTMDIRILNVGKPINRKTILALMIMPGGLQAKEHQRKQWVAAVNAHDVDRDLELLTEETSSGSHAVNLP